MRYSHLFTACMPKMRATFPLKLADLLAAAEIDRDSIVIVLILWLGHELDPLLDVAGVTDDRLWLRRSLLRKLTPARCVTNNQSMQVLSAMLPAIFIVIQTTAIIATKMSSHMLG